MTTTFSENPQGVLNIAAQGPANAVNFQNGGIFTSALVASFGAHIVGATAAIAATGAQPSVNVSGATGTDLAGRVFFNTTASASSGAQFTVVFATAFVNLPYVDVNPISPSGAGLAYWITASVNSFTFNVTTTPANTGSYGFNYMVMG